MELFGFLRAKKQLDSQQEQAIHELERKVGGLTNPNIKAMQDYIAITENLKREYDISKYLAKIEIYSDILNSKKQ